MNTVALAWLAGLLEGEGSFSIIRQRGQLVYARLQVASTDLDVVEKVQRLIGGHIHQRAPTGIAKKRLFVLTVHGQRAIRIMARILPHMSQRRTERILQVIETWRARRNPKTKGPDIRCFGEVKKLGDWVRDPRCTVNEMTVRGRIRKGIDPLTAMTVPPRQLPP